MSASTSWSCARSTIGSSASAGASTKAIQIEAGIEFNVNSTHQLREVLFDKLGLAPQKKTKTGYSTDAASLERLRDQHPIIELLLSYREVEKLRGTYGEGLLNEVAPDGRIHASFNQTVARTGRLSSDQPNLHNIPVRSDEGRQFRKAFVPGEGLRAARRRLQPDRAAVHRAPGRGSRAHRSVRRGHRHPHRDRVTCVRGRQGAR